ncbi:hypothetical protein [Lysinibacillus sp. NPDC093216]|uniref:hypothetical protein n=1 Tax=Lysinibacillus sp. NPDC093216 TaxID=3390576 RepID=UPI003D04AE7C
MSRFAPGSRANRCFLRESEAAAAPMLVTKALSQYVMVLAFVPLLLIPKESPSLHSNQPHHIECFFGMASDNLKLQKLLFFARKRSDRLWKWLNTLTTEKREKFNIN